MDQWLIAALALVVAVIVISVFEIWRAERESRKAVREKVPAAPDTVEKRARRAF
jgi:hypothetical protein